MAVNQIRLNRIGKVRVLMLKGEKGTGQYDDTEIREELAEEVSNRESADTAIQGAIQDAFTDVTDQLEVERARIDALIASGTGSIQKKTIWTGQAQGTGTIIQLSDPITDFDYIDLYCWKQGDKPVLTFPTDAVAGMEYSLEFPNIADTSSHYIWIGEMTLTFATQTITITLQRSWQWNGEANVNASNTEVTPHSSLVQYEPYIFKVVGRKYVTNTEVEDIRVGADGVTYPTAGTAVRTQLTKKADKVENAVNGNLAGLDGYGNLTDSGLSAEDMNNKMDKPENATDGNVAIFGSNSNIIDGGFKASASFPVESASGSIVTIEDGADNVPIKSMTVQIEPVQAGSGDPSPSNVRAITGWTKATINRTALNLLKPMLTEETTVRGVTFTPHEDGSITGSGTSTNSINGSYIKFGVVNLKGGYTYWTGNFVQPTGTTGDFPNLQLANDVTNSAIYRIKNGGYTYSIDADRTVRLNPMGSSSTNFNNTVFYPMFSIKSQGTNFEPYKGNVYEIEFPTEAGTVYGGELTVNEDGSGTLTVTQQMFTIGQVSWTRVALGDHYAFRSNNFFGTLSQNGWCECYKVVKGVSATNTPDDCILLRSNSWDSNNRICIRDDTYTTVSDFKTAMGDYKIVRPAVTPVTYQLTAEQVQTLLFRTLKGLNNVWADTGDISIEYHADPTIFVEEKTKAIKQSIAPIEDGYTASQAYAVGSFLFVGDTLYKVTSAIASGATITPNTNCVATTVAEQLIALA